MNARQMHDLVSHPSDRVLDDFCTQSDVNLLFCLGVGNILCDKIVAAIVGGSPLMDGTEDSFHSFWDRNLCKIFCLVAEVYTIVIETLKLGSCTPVMHFCSRCSLCFVVKKSLPVIETIQEKNFLKNSCGHTDWHLIFLASVSK